MRSCGKFRRLSTRYPSDRDLAAKNVTMKALPNNKKPSTHWSDGFNSIMKLAKHNPYIFFLCIVGALGELFWVSLLIWLLISIL